MIAPVESRSHASKPLQSTAETDAPIRVRRLNAPFVRPCPQSNSVTGLYVGQAALLSVEGELQNFSEGDLLILSGHTAVEAEQAVDVWVLEFRWEALTPFLGGMGQTFTWRQFAAALGTPLESVKRYTVPRDERPTWQRGLHTLNQELRTEQIGYCESAKAYLTLLLVSLARLIEDDIATMPLVEDPLIAKVLAYVEAHFRERVTLEQLAQHVHRSPAHLTTRVREQTGRSLMNYVIERRMQEAEVLLKATDDAVQTVGERVGYPEPSTFSRLFRKRYGVSPTAWREQSKKPTKKLIKLP